MDVVVLPPTEPGDLAFGTMPRRVAAPHGVNVHQVRFSRMVWYNAAVRDEAINQILEMDLPMSVLVGFSKSGLGAWHIVRTVPDLFAATIVFDAPVARELLPPWGTGPFYRDNVSWLADLPTRTIAAYAAAVPDAHHLVLVGGEIFHGEMKQLSALMWESGISHTHLHRPRLAHHWCSGWLEEGLTALLEAGL